MSKDKYDRQTRLWGEGQVLISVSNVICFNSDSLSSEIMKNLVLSGVGKITIVDNVITSQSDLDENFFINKNSIGKPRSQEILLNLLELNPDVKGESFNISPEEYISSQDLSPYDIIISCNLTSILNKELVNKAKQLNKRLVRVTSYGLINMVQLYENFHGNMKLRLLDNPVNDHRLAMPWKELVDFCSGFDLSLMDEMAHKHVPYYVLLIQALIIYRNSKNDINANPNTKQEKEEFKEILNKMKKYDNEENFNEALANYYLCNKDKKKLITQKIEYIFNVINSNKLEVLLHQSNLIMKVFFIYFSCLQDFYKNNNNSFPLVGNIPDMTSDTQSYINLKRVYEAQAVKDRDKMKKLLIEKLTQLNFENKDIVSKMITQPNIENSVDIVDILNKNWPQASLFKYEDKESLKIDVDDFDELYQQVNLIWFLLIKAGDVFHLKNQRYPGQNENFKQDVELFKPYVEEIYKKCLESNGNSLPIGPIEEKYIFEFCRMGKGLVPPCVSIIGSIASQEIIKMITYQFETVNNTIIYNGIDVTLSVMKI